MWDLLDSGPKFTNGELQRNPGCSSSQGLFGKCDDVLRLCMADLLRRALRTYQVSRKCYSIIFVGEQKKSLMALTGKAQ